MKKDEKKKESEKKYIHATNITHKQIHVDGHCLNSMLASSSKGWDSKGVFCRT